MCHFLPHRKNFNSSSKKFSENLGKYQKHDGLQIDKITVWDSGQSGNGSTANFVSGMMKTVPPLNDLFNMAGLNLPSYLKGEEPAESTKNDTGNSDGV